VDDLHGNFIHGSEIFKVGYVFWSMGTLLSSPFPIHSILHPLPLRQRRIYTIVLASIGVGLFIGMATITR
jgi:hypothetical protein